MWKEDISEGRKQGGAKGSNTGRNKRFAITLASVPPGRCKKVLAIPKVQNW